MINGDTNKLIEKIYYNSTGLSRSFSINPTTGLETENLDGRSQYLNFGWTGMYHEPFTNLYHTINREYDPFHERRLSEDPAGYADGLNLYGAYMGVNGIDPHGDIVPLAIIAYLAWVAINTSIDVSIDMAAEKYLGDGDISGSDVGWSVGTNLGINAITGGIGAKLAKAKYLRYLNKAKVTSTVGRRAVVVGGVITADAAATSLVNGTAGLMRGEDANYSQNFANGLMFGSAGRAVGMLAKRLLRRSPGTLCNLGQCFVAGTQVVTDEGLKNIEDIKPGTFVMAKDPTTGKTEYKPVVNTFIIPHTELFTLTYKDNAGDEYELKVSGEHPFWVADKGWLSVRQLAINDKLLITDDTEVTIINLTSEKAESGKTFTTYNFEVADFHTYYVLQEGKTNGVFAVWVHNAKCDPSKLILRELGINIGKAGKNMREHHLATYAQEVGKYTKKFSKIAKSYGLKLDQDWNKLYIHKKYHYSKHPDDYHDIVLESMQAIHAKLGGGVKNQKEFIKMFDEQVRQYVIKNPNKVNKKGWPK